MENSDGIRYEVDRDDDQSVSIWVWIGGFRITTLDLPLDQAKRIANEIIALTRIPSLKNNRSLKKGKE
jgi:hypothetical protein